jgi:hypothetical protein
MKKIYLLLIVCLMACSRDNETTYSLNCEGTLIEISASGESSKTSKQNRQYAIDSNQMTQRSCVKEGMQLICYKEAELPNQQRSKEQLIYNTGDYSLSEVLVLIGIDKSSGKPIFIKNELFRATCPMTIKRKS